VHQAYLKDTQVKINSEFTIIKKYLSGIGASYLKSNGIELAVGDDCAILASKSKLLISTDTSVQGIHFLKSMPPKAIAYRAVSIALSDIAAMGGSPVAFNLSLVMPQIDSDWMKEFKKGLQKVSTEHEFPLIGGDLAKGPLQISITVLGKPGKNTLLRSGAKSGDLLCISDKLGKAYLGLREFRSSALVNAKTRPYLFPKAQILLGQTIARHASAAIDVSDGIIQDLSHLIARSGVGCEIDLDEVPVADNNLKRQCLEFGDDYQLLFTVPPQKIDLLQSEIKSIRKRCHTIGVIKGTKLRALNNPFRAIKNWDHFS
jgi:thiamine-monophosphate kinase